MAAEKITDLTDHLKDVHQDIPIMARERAYSSPIWYTP